MQHTVIIIGAGMSGLLAAIRLLDSGFKHVTILEKAAKLGGTWRDNTYPGLSCDVPAQHYVYSFAPNPDWSQVFAPGAEIQAYFERVAAEHNLHRCIRFNAEVVSACYDTNGWQLSLADGEQLSADIVIAATGVLHHPVMPEIEGIGDFNGAAFHSARWNHEIALDDKRVGVIGTGSTAIQIVPAIVRKVKRLDLFQRTAQWVLPYPNRAFSEAEKQAFRRDPELMAAAYEKWERQFNHTFARAVIGDAHELQRIADRCEQNLRENIQDEQLRQKLTPDYSVACKRLILSEQFYPAIQQANANLVTTGIKQIEAQGVRTEDGELHELDVLVFATGFDGHRFMRDIDIRGVDGISLNDYWRESTRSHRSVSLAGFPNFFMLIGPNSPIGNFSLILIAEMQVNYILQLLAPVASGECSAVAPLPAATDEFQAGLREAMKSTVWVSGCRSWYLDKNGTPVTWPWSFEKFEQDMTAPDWAEYQRLN